MILLKRFQIISLNRSVMRQTLRFRNWRVGIDLLANETDTPALETGQNIYIPILAANRLEA